MAVAVWTWVWRKMREKKWGQGCASGLGIGGSPPRRGVPWGPGAQMAYPPPSSEASAQPQAGQVATKGVVAVALRGRGRRGVGWGRVGRGNQA